MTAVIGAMSQSIVVATSYATLGMGAVAEAINQTNSAAIVCNYKDVSRVSKLKEECPSLKTIIYTRNYVAAKEAAHPEMINGCMVRSFDEVVELGAKSGISESPPTPDHLGLIMYVEPSPYCVATVLVHTTLPPHLLGIRPDRRASQRASCCGTRASSRPSPACSIT